MDHGGSWRGLVVRLMWWHHTPHSKTTRQRASPFPHACWLSSSSLFRSRLFFRAAPTSRKNKARRRGGVLTTRVMPKQDISCSTHARQEKRHCAVRRTAGVPMASAPSPLTERVRAGTPAHHRHASFFGLQAIGLFRPLNLHGICASVSCLAHSLTSSLPLSLFPFPSFDAGATRTQAQGQTHLWTACSCANMWQTLRQRYRLQPTSLAAFLESNCTVSKSPTAALHRNSSLVVAETNSLCIFENLVAEESLARGLSLDKTQRLLLFYVNRPCVVVGRNQNLFQEVALRRAAADGVSVARRASGGGAVFHDEGNLCLCFITHRTRYAPEKTIQLIRLGLCVNYAIDPARLTTTRRHDLFLDGKKITGSAMRVQREIAYHHCTLLVDTPLASLGRYLHPEGEYVAFKTSSVGSVRSPVTTLAESVHIASGQGAMASLKRDMAEFFLTEGDRVLEAAAPWELDVRELRQTFATARHCCADTPLFSLDVVGAVAADMSFIEGEGRRAASGDLATLGEAVHKAASKDWAYAMPAFTSTVLLSSGELQRRLQALSVWPDVVRLSSLAEEQLLAALLQCVFADLVGCGEVVAETEVGLLLLTTVEHRLVTSVVVRRAPSTDAATRAVAPLGGYSGGWVERYLSALLIGHACDAAVEGLESLGDITAVVQGLLHETGSLSPELPDVARDAALLMVARVLLNVWRDKNVFDLSR
ncbi:lipoyltransferase, putative [Leishmania panamensis]|uniref:Lipoyltransferase, putative n=2 Tax=Leishmania panamensis TaxID=5679 RepID=A0A088RKV8_LEIPA